MTDKKEKKEYKYYTRTISLDREVDKVVNELKELFQCTRSSLINQSINTTLLVMQQDNFIKHNIETNEWEINPKWKGKQSNG